MAGSVLGGAQNRVKELPRLLRRFAQAFLFLWMCGLNPAMAADPVGKAELAQGAVIVTRAGRDIPLNTNDVIFQDDEISTRTRAKLVILFIDGTHATLSENAELVVDEFVYNPNGGQNNAALKILSGATRFVAGKMEQVGGPERLKISTPVATIGIRGTDFFIEMTNERLAVALFSGRTVAVSNGAGTTVLQPGEGTDVIGTGSPSPARTWSPDRINRALALTSFEPVSQRPLPYARAPGAGDTFAAALTQGSVNVDLRIRTESVDADNRPRTGEANTMRLRVGYETLAYNGFYAGVSGEITRNLSHPVSNNGVNGRADAPLIPDPSSETLHEAYLGWVSRDADGMAENRIVAGRQRIMYDNERWIGPSEFRQNAQSLDAVSVETRALPHLSLRYAYLWQINRVLGNNPGGTWDSNSHLLGAATDLVPYGTTTAYAYLLELKPVPQFSSATYGIRYDGSIPVANVGGRSLAVTLEAEIARQSDYARNPHNYRLTYALVKPGLTWNNTTISVGYERLGGDGINAVQTPLATLHRHNGWADIFLVTPPRGLRDLNVRWLQQLPDLGPFKLPKLDVRFHDFASAGGVGARVHYGREWDLDINGQVWRYVTLGFRAASYSAIGYNADTTKLWGYLEVHY